MRVQDRRTELLELEADRGFWISEYLKAKDAGDEVALTVAQIMGSIARERIRRMKIAGNY
jgi:hypothetical protein